jgi:hypothetical protein
LAKTPVFLPQIPAFLPFLRVFGRFGPFFVLTKWFCQSAKAFCQSTEAFCQSTEALCWLTKPLCQSAKAIRQWTKGFRQPTEGFRPAERRQGSLLNRLDKQAARDLNPNVPETAQPAPETAEKKSHGLGEMTNDEARIPKSNRPRCAALGFRHSSFFRHLAFVIPCALFRRSASQILHHRLGA